jgi:DMSO/TMAO reductase YedYZ molybdopterin-dependent catalytic subunit
MGKIGIIGILALLLLTIGCVQQQGGAKSLGGVEVGSYQGKDLSAISDFHENSISGPQYVDEASYRLQVFGLVDKPLNLTYADALARQKYSKVVTLNCVEGWSVTILWEGILVSDIIGQAGVKPGADTVIFRSYDGYSTSLPLGYIRQNNIILAYKMNNVTLPPERGFPFQVVAEDKYGYKWAKWITSIELSNDSNFEGYWESRGYNQAGNASGPVYN